MVVPVAPWHFNQGPPGSSGPLRALVGPAIQRELFLLSLNISVCQTVSGHDSRNLAACWVFQHIRDG